MLKNLGFEGRTDMPESLQFGTCLHENILGNAQSAKTPVCSLCPADRRFVAFRDNHKQIKVAALIRLSPGVRAEQPHLLHFKLRGQPPGHVVKQVLANCSHRRNLTESMRFCKLLLLALSQAIECPHSRGCRSPFSVGSRALALRNNGRRFLQPLAGVEDEPAGINNCLA